MKKKSIFASVFILILAMFSGIQANAQAMLQGNPSLENFIGSPGMWVIVLGILAMILFVVFVRRKTKAIPEQVIKKNMD